MQPKLSNQAEDIKALALSLMDDENSSLDVKAAAGLLAKLVDAVTTVRAEIADLKSELDDLRGQLHDTETVVLPKPGEVWRFTDGSLNEIVDGVRTDVGYARDVHTNTQYTISNGFRPVTRVQVAKD